MEQKFHKVDGEYYASVICPDCSIEHLVSHKNYYAQQSFRCASCSQKQAAKKRRNTKLRKTTHGYIKLYRPENPMADKRGEVYEHRLVMSQILGRPLEKWEHIHHKDNNRANNSTENLELVSAQQNQSMKDMIARIIQLEAILKQHHIPIP